MRTDGGNGGANDESRDSNDDLSVQLDLDAVRLQLAETRDEITRVDAKASTLLAGAGVVVGVIIAGIIAGDVQLSSIPWLVALAAILAGSAMLAGLGFVAYVIYPRCGKPERGRARYFAEAAAYDTVQILATALREDQRLEDRLVHQLFHLSGTATAKYRALQRGMQLLGTAVLLGVMAAVLNGSLG